MDVVGTICKHKVDDGALHEVVHSGLIYLWSSLMVLAIASGLNELSSIVSLEHSHSVHRPLQRLALG